MKKLSLLLLLPLILVTASRGQDSTEAAKIMHDLKKQLPEDPLYSSLVKDGWTFQDKAGKGLKQGIKIDPAVHGLIQELNAVDPADITRIKTVLTTAFENADELIELATGQVEKWKAFSNKFPVLFSLKPEEMTAVLTTSAETFLELEPPSDGRFAPGDISTGPGGGHCEIERENDRARCRRNARVESAACSAMTSTILGSLICGAYVLLHQQNCMDQAQIDYLYCLTGK